MLDDSVLRDYLTSLNISNDFGSVDMARYFCLHSGCYLTDFVKDEVGFVSEPD